MKIIEIIEGKFWFLLLLALIFGLITPAFGKSLSSLIIPLLVILAFFTYLKVDFLDVATHIKKPIFILYVLLINLLIIPVVIYWLFRIFTPSLAIGFLLLAATPSAITSPVFTDIMKGNVALNIVICILANLVAPFTMILLLYIFTNKVFHIDLLGVFQTLLLISIVPFTIAQVIRKIKIDFINKTKRVYSCINIVILGLIDYIIIANASRDILSNPLSAFVDIFWLYILFIILQIIGLLVAFWRKKEDKIATAISKAYMNNALSAALALAFFNPTIALLMVLSEIPWSTTLGILKYILRFLEHGKNSNN